MYYRRSINASFQIILVIILVLLSGCVTNNVSTTVFTSTTSTPIVISPTRIGEWQVPSGFKGFTPIPVGTTDITGRINGRDYLFLFAVDNEMTEYIPHVFTNLPVLFILDVSNHVKPVEVSSIRPDYDFMLGAMKLTGNTLYIAATTYLWLIDVSDPSNPKEITKFKHEGFAPVGCILWENYAYIDNYRMVFTQVDVTDPSNPILIGDLPDISIKPRLVRGFGARLFDYVATGEEAGVHILDISNPDSVKEIGYYAMPAVLIADSPVGRVWDIAVSGNYMYLAASYDEYSSSVQIIDISDIATPFEIGRIDVPGLIEGYIQISGQYAYVTVVTRGPSIATLKVLDVTNPKNPIFAGHIDVGYSIPSGYSPLFTVLGDYCYQFTRDNNNIEILKIK